MDRSSDIVAMLINANPAAHQPHLLQAARLLDGMQAGYPQRSVVYYGNHVVGKTQLLHEIMDIAISMNIVHFIISAKDIPSFAERLLSKIEQSLHEIAREKNASDYIDTCSRLLCGFRHAYKLESSSVASSSEEDHLLSGDYVGDLSEVFTALGKAMEKNNKALCIFIDGLQHLSKCELNGLTTALHRCNQLRLPLMVFCTGSPPVLKMLGKACSYSEWIYLFEKIDA